MPPPMGSGGGGQPKPPMQPNIRVTRAMAGQESRIQSAESAREWLCENGLIDTPASKLETSILKTALLQLSRKPETPVELRDGMRAIVYGLDIVATKEAEKIMSEVVADAVEKAMEGYKEALENLAETSVKTVKEMAEQAKERMDRTELEEGQVWEPARRQRVTREGMEQRGHTYADATRKAEHEDITERARNKARQMLVDFPAGSTAIKDLTEKELIAKANIAKDLMGIAGLDAPKVEFIAARRLKNGGVLYELSTLDAANWLARQDVRALFLEKVGAGATIKDRTYQIFVEFVPTSLGEQPEQRMGDIEAINGLHPGSLVAARWVRAPHTRTNPAQKVAHLVVSCDTENGANNAIRRGLIIEGKRVQARKMDQEPRRCLKCQRYGRGHLADECPQEKDTCGLCAKEHKTKECKVTDPKGYACVNCKAKGLRHDHASSARTCPTFVEAKNRLLDRTPEMKYKYYPTEEPWTWAKVGKTKTAAPGRGAHGQPVIMGGAIGGITYQGFGQGRLAGGAPGEGGGSQSQPANSGETTQEPRQTQGGQKVLTQTRLTGFRWSDAEPSNTTSPPKPQETSGGDPLINRSRELDNRIDELMSELVAYRSGSREPSPASQ